LTQSLTVTRVAFEKAQYRDGIILLREELLTSLPGCKCPSWCCLTIAKSGLLAHLAPVRVYSNNQINRTYPPNDIYPALPNHHRHGISIQGEGEACRSKLIALRPSR